MTNPNDLIRRGDVSREVNEYIKDTGSELENWDIDQIINAIPAALDPDVVAAIRAKAISEAYWEFACNGLQCNILKLLYK